METDEIFDYQMQQVALSLRAGMGTGLPLPLGEEQSIDLIVQVWGLDGTPLYRSAGPDWLPQRAVLGFSNVALRGKRYRVFAVQGRFQVVQVAQDIAVRQRMAGQLAWRTVLPTALMLPMLALVVWWVVSHSLAPLERVRQQLSRRAAQDLAPVDEEDLPAEVQPLVTELNALLDRVRQAFEQQQHFVADAAHELRSPLAALKLQAAVAAPRAGRGRAPPGAGETRPGHRPGVPPHRATAGAGPPGQRQGTKRRRSQSRWTCCAAMPSSTARRWRRRAASTSAWSAATRCWSTAIARR